MPTFRIDQKLTAWAATAMITATAAQAAPNLVVNGSFEDITHFVNEGNDTMSPPVGSTVMTGWTVAGSEALAWIGPTNPFSLSASDGSYFLDLTNYSAGGPFSGVTQTIATMAGDTYELTFDLGSSTIWGLPDGLTASAGSASHTFTSTTTTGLNNWEHETLDFTATGATTAVSLVGASGFNYIGLDNVSVVQLADGVTAVPEPASLSLLGMPLVGLGVLRRRRLPSCSIPQCRRGA